MAQQHEARYKNQYLQQFYLDKLQMKNVRLGPLPNVPLSQAFKVTQRRADAIVKDGTSILIIETKLDRQAQAVGQLKLYKELFYKTPELREWSQYSVQLELVVPVRDAMVEGLCHSEGIKYVVFGPQWVLNLLAVKQGR